MAEHVAGVPELREINDIRNIMLIRRRNLRRIRERTDPFDKYSDNEFRRRYRLSKNTARFVIDIVHGELECSEHCRSDSISPALQVLITLRYYSKGCYQSEVGDIHAVSQSTVSRIVSKVSRVIASLLPRFIKYPDRLDQLKIKFYSLCRFPNVVGCVDCTHVRIKNPNKDEAMLYCNRKGYYSLNVQVVCDADCKILDIVARWRGSAHDSRIWAECSLKKKIEDGQINGIILGDGGYPCTRYLLTPLLHPQTPAEEAYNRAHISTRNVVERCFGQWKGMFRALFKGMDISLATTKAAIAATAVLYNIRKMRGEEEDYDSDSDQEDFSNEECRTDNEAVNNPPQAPAGNLFRQQFIGEHFQRTH